MATNLNDGSKIRPLPASSMELERDERAAAYGGAHDGDPTEFEPSEQYLQAEAMGEQPEPIDEDEAKERLDVDWQALAQSAYTLSTNYVDANMRSKWEDWLSAFQNKHPSWSKYNSALYKHRSKIFRPKSRSMVRKLEASAAMAFFSTQDPASIEAIDQSNKESLATAEIVKALLQYRLSTPGKGPPWFLTLIGALQDTAKQGIVASYQYWKYKAQRIKVKKFEPQPDGSMLESEVEEDVVQCDKPDVQLMPAENIRFDPAASWVDPVNDSPYLIRLVPTFMCDVEAFMEDDAVTGRAKWKEYSRAEILGFTVKDDTTRSTRHGESQDPATENSGRDEAYTMIDVREYFIRHPKTGEDFVFWMLGDEKFLTDPVPLKREYFHGVRPVVIGISNLETHRATPDSLIGLGMPLQIQANDIANTRLDNVKLALQKRWQVRRGSNVDTASLNRNVPGGVTLVGEIGRDLAAIDVPDVTSSAYAEQDRINVDYDELTGNFSQSSVMTNRQLNETVGGMEMIGAGANMITEYTLRLFTETWVEPVLRQLVLLEQNYESDEVVLSLAKQKSQLFARFGIDEITDSLLRRELVVTVNVGLGATNPQQKLQRFLTGVTTWTQMQQTLPPNAQKDEISKELFGLLGYRDPERFFSAEDPNAAANAFMAQVQQQAQAIMAEAQKQAEAIMKQAEAKQQQAETAERAALEEQIQLQNRQFAQGLKELRSELISTEQNAIGAPPGGEGESGPKKVTMKQSGGGESKPKARQMVIVGPNGKEYQVAMTEE